MRHTSILTTLRIQKMPMTMSDEPAMTIMTMPIRRVSTAG